MKLLLDMNISPLWVKFLEDAGFVCLHWSSVGEPAALDSEIMKYAIAHDLVIFTHDLDFGALLAINKSRLPSVFQLRAQDILPAAIGEIVVRTLRATQETLELGALVTVDQNRNRIRMLPF
jgi:predicted nuclease of predicted toxin-antitoxin system